MTEENLRLVQLGNLASMQGELEKLKKKSEKEFRDWLKKPGEYLIEPQWLWAIYERTCQEYKELRLKMLIVKERLDKQVKKK